MHRTEQWGDGDARDGAMGYGSPPEVQGMENLSRMHPLPLSKGQGTGGPWGLSPLPGEPARAQPMPMVRRRADWMPPRRVSAARRRASPRASSASSPCARPSAALRRRLSSAASPRAASTFSCRLRASASSFFSLPRASSKLRARSFSRCRNSPSASDSRCCRCRSWGVGRQKGGDGDSWGAGCGETGWW